MWLCEMRSARIPILGNPYRLEDYPTRTGKKNPEPVVWWSRNRKWSDVFCENRTEEKPDRWNKVQLNLHLQFLFFFISSLNRNIQSNLKNKLVSFKSRFPMTKKVVCTQNVHTFTNIVHCSKLIHKRKTGFFENRFLNNVSLCHL